MLKQILTFSGVLLLCACATTPRQTASVPEDLVKPVDFFTAGKTQAGFKITGKMDDMVTDGVLTVKQLDKDAYSAVLLMGGLYRVLDVQISPDAVTYYYLFKEVDNTLVRARITQLLDLLFIPPVRYLGSNTKKGQVQVRYKGPRAKEIFVYEKEARYPHVARTVTTLNTAELSYRDYMPISADGDTLIPHELEYKDGKITLELQLISLR